MLPPIDFEIVEPVFADYLLANAPVEKLATGFRWTEGPVWFADAGALLFSDLPNDTVWRWVEDGGVSKFRQPSGFANGHTRDLQGRLITCSHLRRAVIRTELDGSETVLAERYQGRRLNSPNDVVVKSDGSIWFTDPHFGIMLDYEGLRAEQELPCHVYRLDPTDGVLDLVADTFEGPNGICFSPDERVLYVAETGRVADRETDRHIRAFDVIDGRRLASGRILHKVTVGMADGFRCDEDGNIWTSAGDGVHCISAQGQLLGKVKVPEVVANLTFGGRARSRLFICGSTSLYAVYLNRRGVQVP